MDLSKENPMNLSHAPDENELTNQALKKWQARANSTPTIEYLPPGISKEQWPTIVQEFKDAIGEESVFTGERLKHNYQDPYAMNEDEGDKRGSAAAVRPKTVEQIQKVLKIANHHKIPVWTVSRGRNLGYGGPSARVKGSVIIDLQTMNRIIEINDKFSYYTVEPGVSFFQLFQTIQKEKKDIWCSVPALGWGSVVGNALDRGWGYTPHGDHSNQICGLEVVLADGRVVRTGMGAIEGSKAWPLFRGGYGPTYDSMFQQSNFGIVTKMTLWASPAPRGFISCKLDVPDEADLAPMVDIFRELLLRETIQNHPVIGNVVREMCKRGPRKQWWPHKTSVPDWKLKELQKEFDMGWWDATFGLYGPKEVIQFHYKEIEEAFKAIPGARLTKIEYYPKAGEKYVRATDIPLLDLQTGTPTMWPLTTVGYRGEDGGHISFSPVLPSDGKAVLDFYYTAKDTCRKHGFEFSAGLHQHLRHTTHINMIHFDRDSQEDKDTANRLFVAMVADARAAGYGEYRAHVEHMDLVADVYNFNGGALRTLNQQIKDLLDPNGILSPGKQGIWPAKYREGAKQLSSENKL